jgi:two-component system, NarL family, nitrate/nitrite response regulator NarL
VQQQTSGRSDIPVRILIAGRDLLSDTLANALGSYGFATKHVHFGRSDIERGIEWCPDLVIVETESLELSPGISTITRLRRAGLRVCVIDSAESDHRLDAWLTAGAWAFIDKTEPFAHLFTTINRLLRAGSPAQGAREPSVPVNASPTLELRESNAGLFAVLTEREKVVLAELMEGHCAEEIAKSAVVSISTVRSQIKAILQKLGVNSQLAAVAMARRTGWSPEDSLRESPAPSNSRRSVS